MPTILLLNQYYAPDEAATAQMLADLGEGLATGGARVIAICSDRAYADPSRRYPARETIRGVEIRRIRTTGFGRATNAGRIADYLTFLLGAKLQLLFGPKPDAIVSLSTPPMVALLGTMIGRLRGARTLFWSMDVYPDVAYELGAIRKGSIIGRLVASLAHLTHQLPDVVVALGETMKAKLEAGGAKNVTVIHNWADGDAIKPMPVATNALRREWGWDDRFVLLYSGNMGLGHEFETALNGVAELAGKGIPDFGFRTDEGISDFGFRISDLASPARSIGDEEPRSSQAAQSPKSEIRNPKSEMPLSVRNPQSAMPLLAFIGTGPRRAEVEHRAGELGLLATREATAVPKIRNTVEFRDYVDRTRLCDSLTAAAVHLVTMRDGMQGLIVPSKIYGILAAGRPTIYVGPAEGEIYDIVTEGNCGVHVAIGDGHGFANALARYASDPALLNTHSENARRLFDQRFSRKRGIDEFRKALKL